MEIIKRTGITDKEEVFKTLTQWGYRDLYIWQDPPGAFYDWHTHNFDEIRWVLKGEILIETETGEKYLLKAGDVMEVPAKTRHRAKVGKEGVVYVCGSRF